MAAYFLWLLLDFLTWFITELSGVYAQHPFNLETKLYFNFLFVDLLVSVIPVLKIPDKGVLSPSLFFFFFPKNQILFKSGGYLKTKLGNKMLYVSGGELYSSMF